ncbi:MAG: acetylglutamate kinase [Candidatus Methanomethylophilaceae archaeon]
MSQHPSSERIYLIKFGGNAMGGPEDLKRLAADLLPLLRQGRHVVVVHGGGPEITRAMEAKGLQARKVDGIRVTDDAALQVAEEVLQSINEGVVKTFQSMGIDAVGMAGHSQGLVSCVKKAPLPCRDAADNLEMVDLVNVGEVDQVNVPAIRSLLQQGKVPVIYPICATGDGRRMNVNADTLAYSTAAALGCEEMILITDVPGILLDVKDPSSLLTQASKAEVERLIDEGVIRDGMIPKVEGCLKALQAGVRSTRMVNGKDPQSILGDVIHGAQKGTRVYMQ